MQAFQNIMNEIEARDLKTLGPKFTWFNRRSGNNKIMEKLDRFMANQVWMDLFSEARTYNLDFFCFDHRAVKVVLEAGDRNIFNHPTHSFTFENKCLLEEGFKEAISHAWRVGQNSRDFQERLSKCGEQLSKWAKEEVGNTKNMIKEVSKKLDKICRAEEAEWDYREVKLLERELKKLSNQ
ncbi:hypothetical protein ACS0TY_010190 [Phlomoides rotata]